MKIKEESKKKQKTETQVKGESDEVERFMEDLVYEPGSASSGDEQDQVEITGVDQLAPPSPTLDHDIEMTGDPNLGGVHSPDETNPSSSSTERRSEQYRHQQNNYRQTSEELQTGMKINWNRPGREPRSQARELMF